MVTEPEFSIVMPCLDEEKTVGICIDKARACAERLGVSAEIIIEDNGSTDRSVEIANSLGARVVNVVERGYGAALLGGITEAKGQFVIMADADDSYDFSRLDLFVDGLRAGADLVMGDRFAGRIDQDAMPWLHRYVGNPILSFIGRLFYGTSVRDFHCGLRGFRRDRILELNLACPGMEFASEMVLKCSLAGLRIVEVPTTLAIDGRGRAPHLRSFRDGWRHLQLLLLYSPRWLFLIPGMLVLIVGVAGMLVLLAGPVQIGGVAFDIHTLLYASALVVLGLQMVMFSLLMRVVATGFGRMPDASSITSLIGFFTLERGLTVGGIAMAAGVLWTLDAVFQWGAVEFSALDPSVTMRAAIPAVTLLISGFQIIMTSFFLGAVQLYRKPSS